MSIARDIGLLFHRYLTHLLRNPVWLAVGFLTPILYLALFMPLLQHLIGVPGLNLHGNVLDLFLPGILALLAFTSGISSGYGTLFELKDGVIERLRVTPASRIAILTAPILASMMLMFVFDAFVVVISLFLGFKIHWLGLVVLVGMLAILMTIMASFSIAIALVTKQISGFAAIINALNLPTLLLAGVLLPISLAPSFVQIMAHFNPLYYAVQASRELADGTLSKPAVWQAFAVLVPLCALIVTWATRVVRNAIA
jgi:ABC-2 type transport system permease protein